MQLRLHIITVSLLLISFCTTAAAQDDVEYRMEIGGGIGMMTYEGDFNGNVLSGSNMSPSATLILRRVINPYSALRFALGYGKLKGSSAELKTYYPDFSTGNHDNANLGTYDFSNSLADFSATYEYNFQPYGTGRDYRGAKRVTPFISFGIGFTYVNSKNGTADLSDYTDIQQEEPTPLQAEEVQSTLLTGGKSVFTANLPLALGVKCKIGDRLNLCAEWAFHLSLSDKLDGVKDPYRIRSSGFCKNTDCYSNLQLSLTYSFWEKCSTCNKD